jgi:DNA polymerase III delta prime subunit
VTMGRFRYVEDDQDQDQDDEVVEDSRHWEFVAEPGNEGAIVPRETAVSSPSREEHAGSDTDPSVFSTNQRAESSLSEAQSDWLGDYYYANESKRKRKVRWWFWILLVAVFIQIAILYAPPAPPPTADEHEHEGWEAFLLLHTSQLRESVTALLYHTPTHIGRWWMLGLVTDVQQWYHNWKLEPPCQLRVPTGGGDNDDDKFVLDKFLFGQNDAVDAVTDAIQAWEPDSSPLLIYLAGMKGTGKTTLARAMAKQLFPNECSQDGLDSSILTIDAGEFADKTDNSSRSMDETSVRMQLAQKIGRHVQRLDGGIVILQDVDRMAPALLVWLCRELRRQDGPNTGDLSASGPSSLRLLDRCRKVVFVFISSSVGAKTVMTNIRTHGGMSNIPRPGLLLDMLHEIGTHFGSTSVGQSFHAVAPFFPLGRQALSQILRQKVDELSQSRAAVRWSHLTITDAAVEALLDPTQIEYLSWKQLYNPDAPPLLTFSSTGASALQEGTPLMNKLKSKIKVCFAGAQAEKVAVVDYDPAQGEVVMEWCSQSSALLEEEWKPPCDVTCRYKI